MSTKMSFKIYRYDTQNDPVERYDVFTIQLQPRMNVLDALFKIQATLDDSLVFRYSCRGAVCGSCSMIINKIPRLACRTQISNLANEKPLGLRNAFGKMMPTIEWDPKKEVLIEPLTNFKIIKDLAVDLRPFWAKLEKVKPWILESSPNAGEMSPDKAKDLGKAANCFLCALCVGSCPVNAQYPEYLGPAALAQAWRYVEGLTDPLATSRLGMLNSKPEGALGCEYYYNCVKVCPRDVAPAREIRLLRDRIGKP